ncbi:MAG: hypothetical protein M0R06_08105 [Sphaerochaeta sp.]|jgi:glycosyltransferase involved in cell wall biosynthesis|nr:hypothetical protein [Sphaerochaeta sp.]
MDTGEREDSQLHIREGSGDNPPHGLPRIHTLTTGFPGASRPLQEGERLGWWSHQKITYHRDPIPEADVYILAAWHPEVYDYLVRRLSFQSAKVIVLWTSSIGEMEMMPVEVEFLEHILHNPCVDEVWFGTRTLARIYPEKGFYAPYPVKPEIKAPRPKRDIVTLFCPPTLKKNIYNQLAAVSMIQKEQPEITLVTNLPPAFHKVFPLKGVIGQGWLPDKEYKELLSLSRLNLAVSWAETQNYQVLEALELGVMSLTSQTVPISPFLVSVTDPNNPNEIAAKALGLLNSSILDPMILQAQSLVMDYARDCNEKCLQELKKGLKAPSVD